MKVLIIEDDRKIKTETIDDVLASLGYECDWAQDQREANALLIANQYDLILQDLQIPSRPGGKDSAEFGKHTLKQIRAKLGRDVPVILMTAQYQNCVDMMTELQEIGIDGSIAKPFPTSGRTLAVVITEVMEKHRRFRQAAKAAAGNQPLVPFTGGVLAFHPMRIDFCGETVATDQQKGYGWPILQLVRTTNEHGKYHRFSSSKLASKLGESVAQNTAIQAMKTLRERFAATVQRLGYACGIDDVIANGGHGYHLRDWIVVEEYDEAGALIIPASHLRAPVNAKATRSTPARPAMPRLNERQLWVLECLAVAKKFTRRQFELQFHVSARTAKRDLAELIDLDLIIFDRAIAPGHYALTQAPQAIPHTTERAGSSHASA